MSSLDNNKSVDKKYWRSLDQLQDTPGYRNFADAEFPEQETEKQLPVSRRAFLSTVGATLAFAGLTGCRRPVEEIVPYVDAPEDMVLGEPEHYATSMPFGTSSYGLVVTCFEGRPTKIEGNNLHPSSLGKSNNFMQASILNLYDPDRSKKILNGGKEAAWEGFIEGWNEKKLAYNDNDGEGLAVLCTESNSPSLARLKSEFSSAYPKADWVTFDSVSDENIFAGARIASGKSLRPAFDYSKAEIILALDSDPFMLDSENVINAFGFAEGRRINNPSDSMNRLYTVEPGYTLTGAMSDHRLQMPPSRIADFALALAHELESRGVSIPALTAYGSPSKLNLDENWINAVATDLLDHKGKSLISAGRRQSKTVHSLIFAINHALGNIGNTVSYQKADDLQVSDRTSLKNLVSNMKAGKVRTLIIMDGDPVTNAPVDLEFDAALNAVDQTVYLGSYSDDTASLCNWHINNAHYLESWGDCRSADSTPSVIQPMIEPLFYGKSDLELLQVLIHGESKSGYEIVRQTWSDILRGHSFESTWRKVLHDGVFAEGKSGTESVRITPGDIEAHLAANPFRTPPFSMEVIFAADSSVYGGQYSNNGWMQELPDPLTKLIWDNAALISVSTASENGLENGDIVSIKLGDRSIEIPVWILPGHAYNTITLPLGYGLSGLGRIANGVGYRVNDIRTLDHMDYASGVSLQKTGEKHELATTQNHGSMEGRPLIREATIDEYHHDPAFAQHEVHVPDLKSLWEEHKYDEGNQWGMSIDLNACIGCGACTLSCQSENNIPVVGKENADYGREMHWMRIDRYFNGDLDNPTIGFQPMACQHCEMAPCEQVCPVAATVHDSEGLNVMTYNRCIGTRYCSNNCPYKVRRFNFFNYTNTLPELIKMAQNPDVTVRSRGVMEKCSYCLQRINRSKRTAKLEDRELRDGEMVTACQQACPTEAIKFGNILDQKSNIVKAKNSERTYEVLAELNLRPRTSYQARLRNPNPALTS
ncbi:MAG TPA: 4Fe-4S dicluster domain-containing protein [Bacteroidetes bacterium]|nr:tetrathionate reductase subunit B precursor [bacterium BMS3Bbin04]HDO65520.1 4Fe-4S dicluster domain-containing protein [Bacteroidota bacterium]HEX04645.1 4Fe-4S dicluster domain-containing protein [Bacteroidota bacterium]